MKKLVLIAVAILISPIWLASFVVRLLLAGATAGWATAENFVR